MTSRNGSNGAVAEREAEAPAEVQDAETKTKVVAIVGTATSSRELVHQQGDDVEIWGLNASYDWMPRWSRWFEMHDRERYDHIQGTHLAWLQAATFPVYMVQHYEDIPASVPFPIGKATQGGRFRALFTSSVAYMLGLAIAEGFQEIRLCGVDMAMDSEYAYQRSACEYWLGVADALGVKVVIPSVSPIGKAPLYGIQSPDTDRMLIDWRDRLENERLRKFQDYLTTIHSVTDEFRINMGAIEGALQANEKMKRQDGG